MATFSNLSNETKSEIAIQMVILDAIEKGHTDTAGLIEYMKSEVFELATKNYIDLMNGVIDLMNGVENTGSIK